MFSLCLATLNRSHRPKACVALSLRSHRPEVCVALQSPLTLSKGVCGNYPLTPPEGVCGNSISAQTFQRRVWQLNLHSYRPKACVALRSQLTPPQKCEWQLKLRSHRPKACVATQSPLTLPKGVCDNSVTAHSAQRRVWQLNLRSYCTLPKGVCGNSVSAHTAQRRVWQLSAHTAQRRVWQLNLRSDLPKACVATQTLLTPPRGVCGNSISARTAQRHVWQLSLRSHRPKAGVATQSPLRPPKTCLAIHYPLTPPTGVCGSLQGYLAHKKQPTPLGPP